MSIEQQVSKDYEIIEPESIAYDRWKKWGRKLLPYFLIYALFSFGVTGITIDARNTGITKKQILEEKSLLGGIGKPLRILSRPGIELGFYLYGNGD